MRGLAAMETARRLTRILVEEYDAARVVLVGALARREAGGKHEIDLVVGGVPKDMYLLAAHDMEQEAGDFAVDLIPLESATDAMLAVIETEGEVLWDRSRPPV